MRDETLREFRPARHFGRSLLSCLFAATVLLLSATGCSTDQPAPDSGSETTAEAPSKLKYETITFQKKHPECGQSDENCTLISFSYPEFTSGADPRVLDELNGAVRAFIMRELFEERPGGSIEEISAMFLAEYDEARKRFPGSMIPWTLERVVSVEHQGSDLFEPRLRGGQLHGRGSSEFISGLRQLRPEKRRQGTALGYPGGRL